jgi:Beta-propeller repeat
MDGVRRFLTCGFLTLLLAVLAGCGSSSSSSTSSGSGSTTTPTLSSISVNPSTVNGGKATTATITLSEPALSGGFTVTLSSSSDVVTLPTINSISGPVEQFTVPAGQTTGTFKIQTIPVGSNQSVVLTATSQVLTSVQTTLNIISTHPLSVSGLSLNMNSVTSGQVLVGTVTLNAPAYSPGQPVTITSSDPAVQPENPVTVPTNATSVGFSIYTFPIATQRTVTVTATLNSSSVPVQLTVLPTGTAITSLVVVPFTAAGGTSLTGMVTVSPPAPAGGAVITLSAAFTNPATPPGTPLPVTLPTSVTVPAGATQAQFAVMSSAVTVTTDVTLTATLNSTGVNFTVEIVPSISLAGVSCLQTAVTSGNTLSCSVTLSIPAPAGGETVQLMSSDPAVLPVPASVTIAGGSASQSFNVVGGVVTTPDRITLTATLQGSTTAPVTGIITVVPVSALNLTSFTLSATVVQGGAMPGGTLTGSITIAPAGAPPGGLAVSLSSSDPSVQFPNGPTVTVPQYSLAASFPISTIAVASQVSVTITVNVNAFPLTATLTVVPPPQVTGLTLSPTTVVGGNSVVGTVTLSVQAPQVGTTVMLQSDSPLAQLGATLTVTQGNTSAVFAITTLPVSTQQMATITASIGASSQKAILTITPVPPDLRLLFLNPSTVLTGRTSTGTVTLTAPAPAGGLSVTLASANPAVVSVPPSVTIPAGTTSATFLVRAASGVASSTSVVISGQVVTGATSTLTVLPVASGTVTEQVVLSGETNSTDFPIHPSSGAFQGTLGAGDDTGFVASIGLSTPVNGATTPSYTFSTYLGGMSSFGQVRDVFVDSSGNVFACGVTMDANLRTTSNAAQATYGGGKDAFIAEFNSSGALQYLSYLGGAGDETCNSLTVDSSGNIYVIGSETNSTAMGAANLAGTTGAFQTANAGGSDFFVARINPTGSTGSTRLVWLTFVGGSGDDFADGRIAVSASGVLVISGTSQSTAVPPNGFPIPSNQGRPPLNGVGTFGVVIGLSPDGSRLVSSTFLFGHSNGANPGTPTTTTASGGIAFDSSNNLYVCGQTNASDLPVSTNAFQPALQGQQDAYVAVLNTSGVITRLTYLGGTSASTIQACKGIAVDTNMQPVIVMPTDASDYPVTTGGVLSGPSDIAVTKLTNDLSAVVFSRLVGGSGSESADAARLKLDSAENLYFSLATNSVDFPVTANALQGTFAGASGGNNTNVVVVKLSSDGSTILYGSYLGGTQNNSTTSVFYHLN